jgi:hypothetical protein
MPHAKACIGTIGGRHVPDPLAAQPYDVPSPRVVGLMLHRKAFETHPIAVTAGQVMIMKG